MVFFQGILDSLQVLFRGTYESTYLHVGTLCKQFLCMRHWLQIDPLAAKPHCIVQMMETCQAALTSFVVIESLENGQPKFRAPRRTQRQVAPVSNSATQEIHVFLCLALNPDPKALSSTKFVQPLDSL